MNPNWNSEWFRFDVDDLELQDEPLQIRIMDYDTYSANDAIGKVGIPHFLKVHVLACFNICSMYFEVHKNGFGDS